jgi:predicted MFS family arabinose efflux permease
MRMPERMARPAGAAPLWLLALAAFLVTADSRVINPLLRVIAGEFHGDVGAAGVIVTAYTIPYGLCQLVYGPLGDRISKVRIMAVALTLFAFGTGSCALAPTLGVLTLLRLLTGAAAAALIPLSLAYIGDTFAYTERQAAIGRFLGAIALGQILSTSLGGIVVDYLNWRGIFLFYGAVSLAVCLLFWRLARSPGVAVPPAGTRSSRAIFAPYWQILRDPAPRLVILAVFVEGVFFFGGFSYLGAFLRDQYGLLYIIIGFILSGFGIGSLIYSRTVGTLVRRLGEDRLILLGGGLSCTVFLAIAGLGSWPLCILLIVSLGFSYYLLHGTLQTRATELTPEARGTAVSLFAFSFFLGQGIGAAVLGAVVDGPGYSAAFATAGVAMALLVVVLVAAGRRYARRLAAVAADEAALADTAATAHD